LIRFNLSSYKNNSNFNVEEALLGPQHKVTEPIRSKHAQANAITLRRDVLEHHRTRRLDG